MDVEQTRTWLRSLPHVAETMQWGANLVYWVGDKSLGGKMFALMDLEEQRERKAVLSFYAGPERLAALLENDGVIPAPYLARAKWVALTHWDALPTRELKPLLTAAHAGILARLPGRVRAEIEGEGRERRGGKSRRAGG